VIVAANWVLTARHCNRGGGFTFEAFETTGTPSTTLTSEEVIEADSDALLFRISSTAFADPIARTVDLPRDELLVGAPVELAGYGRTEDGAASPGLRFLAQLVSRVETDRIVVDGRGRAGACVGDSGGPLLVRTATGALAVAGILSAGAASCLDEDHYLRVDTLGEWLAEYTGFETATREPCAEIDSSGVCRTGVAVWCEDGAVTGEACDDDEACGWDASARGYRCIEQSTGTCNGVTDLGDCDALGVVRCEEGRLDRRACDCDEYCAWSPESVSFECQ
jgi:hypothetical protein